MSRTSLYTNCFNHGVAYIIDGVHHLMPTFESLQERARRNYPRRVGSGLATRTRMESPESPTARAGGPYPEEVLLEAYNLEWESIELRRQRLQKTWEQFLLVEEMEQEERCYQQQLRRLQRQEQERETRELAHRQQVEALRQQRDEAAALREKREAALREKEAAALKVKERAEEKRQKKLKQVTVKDTQTIDEEPIESMTKMPKPKTIKPKTIKPKTIKPKTIKPKKTKPAPPKRITPISLPPVQPEDDESVAEENQNELGGCDSPPPELPDDGLLNMLSLDKESDSDVDDEPSMVSLILPVAQDSPKRHPSPLRKKMLTPQKRLSKKKVGSPLDFNFTNAEAKRQAQAAAEATARAEQGESDEDDTEPEPMPEMSTPKKRLKRRKEVAKERQKTNGAGKSLMSAMANTAITVKPKKGTESAVANKGQQTKTKPQTKYPKTPAVEAQNIAVPAPKKKVGGKAETISIKQRLANAELLARMNKMQDMNTPKVLGKKTKKKQKQGAARTLAAKRAEFRKVLASDAIQPDEPQRDKMIEEGDLNISLNSSGLISDNDSPENLRAPTRKRTREAVEGDVTPTKKLQFLEITKRLAKSPMPRFLRTPTPLMSPVVSSALVKSRAASPGPRVASARTTAPTRRMNSAPVRPKKTTNANRFGIPAGGANTAASGGFSMFDAFVNSGSSGAIPRLKTKIGGDESPSV